MSDAYRDTLARSLAEIDQLLAKLEQMANDPQNEDHDRALAMITVLQNSKRSLEDELRQGDRG